MAGEGVERPAARERQDRAGVELGALFVGTVGDVLAEALLGAALQVHGGRHPFEFRGHGAGASLERVGVDLERQLGKRVVQGHRIADSTVPPTSQDVGP